MDHWDAVLPGKVLRVQHEDVLDDVEAQTAGCSILSVSRSRMPVLNFHKTDRAVRTASSEQVRQPINRKGRMPGSRSSLGLSHSNRLWPERIDHTRSLTRIKEYFDAGR
jgi:hypothetical protein